MADARLFSVEQENNALRSRLRHQQNVLSVAQLRESHEKEAHLVPILRQRLTDIETTHSRTATELAETQQLLRAFQQETFALRTLIKFSEYPEIADVARLEGERLAALEESKRLREQLRAAQNEHTACQKRCEEALVAAEQYRRALELTSPNDVVDEGEGASPARRTGPTRPRPQQRIKRRSRLWSRGASLSDDGAAPGDQQTPAGQQPDLQESSFDTEEGEGSEGTPSPADDDALAHLAEWQQSGRMLSSSQAVHYPAVTRHTSDRLSQGTLTVSDMSDVEAEREKIRHAMSVLRGQNALLTRRIRSVVSQNTQFITTIAELEMRCAELSNRVGHSP